MPLGRQAVKVLQDLRPFTGGSWYVFPGRATALTMLHEALEFILEAIEGSVRAPCSRSPRYGL